MKFTRLSALCCCPCFVVARWCAVCSPQQTYRKARLHAPPTPLGGRWRPAVGKAARNTRAVAPPTDLPCSLLCSCQQPRGVRKCVMRTVLSFRHAEERSAYVINLPFFMRARFLCGRRAGSGAVPRDRRCRPLPLRHAASCCCSPGGRGGWPGRMAVTPPPPCPRPWEVAWHVPGNRVSDGAAV